LHQARVTYPANVTSHLHQARVAYPVNATSHCIKRVSLIPQT
jgi:hypothetical protein